MWNHEFAKKFSRLLQAQQKPFDDAFIVLVKEARDKGVKPSEFIVVPATANALGQGSRYMANLISEEPTFCSEVKDTMVTHAHVWNTERASPYGGRDAEPHWVARGVLTPLQ